MTMRVFFGCLAALVLSLASVTAAVARGQMAGSYQMVVCAGADIATLTLDPRGVPVGVVHHCPDCTAAAGLALLAVPVQVLLSGVTKGVPLDMAVVALRAGVAPFVAVARGPPVPV